MHTASAKTPMIAPNPASSLGDCMVMTPDRIFYHGKFCFPSHRMHGAHTVYVAHEQPFQIAVDGAAAQPAWLAVVPANQVHLITTTDRLIRNFLIEPETADVSQFAAFDRRGELNRPSEHRLMDASIESWLAGRSFGSAGAGELDQFFFGAARPHRRIDLRIERVISRIRLRPHEQFSATECARITGLSFSRFVHLFKQEIGMTFRTFCAWKRARAVIPSMGVSCNLTHLALQAGYPDSSHFCHSMRRIFGLRPRDIVTLTRQLALQCAPESLHGFIPVPRSVPLRASRSAGAVTAGHALLPG